MPLENEKTIEQPGAFSNGIPASRRLTYIACFFLSGAAGLIYQIVWIRILSLVFGNTLYAVSMVVAGFLAGLALGSWFWGAKADRLKDPLAKYINLEILIAVSAFLTTFIIYMLDDFIISMMSVESIDSGFWIFLRFVLVFFLLAAPTSFMGATTPVMTKFFINNIRDVGRGVGALYAANTYGAMFGCFMSGFLLVPFLGVKGTLWVAIALNLAVAGTLALIGKGEPETDGETIKEARSIPKQKKKQKSRKKTAQIENKDIEVSDERSYVSIALALSLIAVSGLCSLIYEILWTRAFIVYFKSTVYLFSNLLAVFLLGMAIGSHIISKKADSLKDPLKIFGLSQIGIGVSGALSAIFFLYSNQMASGLIGMLGGVTWAKDIIVMAMLMLVVFIVPTVLIGVSYPLICRLTTDNLGKMGRNVGEIYAIGTAGGILGSIVAGFLIIPTLGLQNGIFLASAISLANGYVAIFNSKSAKGIGWVIPVSAGIALVTFISFAISGLNIGLGQKTEGSLVFSKEGTMGTVRVTQKHKNGPLTLMVNNYQLATSGDVAVRFGNIPLLLKPDSEDVLLISLGSGITAGSVWAHPVKRIDCVEIVPNLIDVQPLFEKDNHNVIGDKRFNLAFWDGRHFVKVVDRKYDLVISDLFQPDSAGVGSLYSLEHFQNVKAKLKKNGAMAQWLPLYQLSPENLKVIMRTFAYAFEHVIVWAGDVNSELPTLMLYGSADPIMLKPLELSKRLEAPEIAKDMIEYADPLSFLSFFVMDRKALLEYTEGSPINTDNRPVVEYTAPYNIWNRKSNSVANFSSLINKRKIVTSLIPGATQDEKLSSAIERYFNARTEILLAKVQHARKNFSEEIKHYQKAAKSVPGDPYLSMSIFDLGYMYYQRRDYSMSSQLFEWAQKSNPDLLEARFYLAKSLERMGKKDESVKVLEELVRYRPELADKIMAK